MFVLVNKPSQEGEAVANMICIAYYYCMRPGEYTGTSTNDWAFALEDIAFYIGLHCVDNEFFIDLKLGASTSTIYCFTK